MRTHTHTQFYLHEGMDVLPNLITVVISQYICISNHYTVHLKLTQCYMSIISVKLEKNRSRQMYVSVVDVYLEENANN